MWFITCKTKEATTEILSKGVLSIRDKEGILCSQGCDVFQMRIHWAPYYLPPESVTRSLRELLPPEAEIKASGIKKSKIEGAEHIATMVRFAVVRYPGRAEDVLHLITAKVEGETVEMLCTVPRRAPLCLK